MKSGKGDLTTLFLSRCHGPKRMDFDVDAFAIERGNGWALQMETVPDERFFAPLACLGLSEGIGNMVDFSAVELVLMIGREKEVALEKKELERAGFSELNLAPTSIEIARWLFLAFPLAGVVHEAVRRFGAHRGVLVGQMKKPTGEFDGDRLVAIE